nr:MAG TPA: hypothetical protein [Caudoviricetes sp.]
MQMLLLMRPLIKMILFIPFISSTQAVSLVPNHLLIKWFAN